MKKTDFQLDDELTSNFRNIKPQGTADLLHDRYDSVFRRNLMEPEPPLVGAGKKRVQKAVYKWHKQGGSFTKKLSKETAKKRQRLDEQMAGKGGLLKNDLILI